MATYTNDQCSCEILKKLSHINEQWISFFRSVSILSEKAKIKYQYPKAEDFRKKLFGINLSSIDKKLYESEKIQWRNAIEGYAQKICAETINIEDEIIIQCPKSCGELIVFDFILDATVEKVVKSFLIYGEGGAQIEYLHAKCNNCGIFEVPKLTYTEMKFAIISNHLLPEVQSAIKEEIQKVLVGHCFSSDADYLLESMKYASSSYVWSPPYVGGMLR